MIKVVEEGFYSTVQDKGRFGYRHFGVPISGVMDAYAAHLANALLENEEDRALLELTMIGPKLEFDAPTFIAITGAPMAPYINGEGVAANCVLPVQKGDVLSFDHPTEGLRAYLAVKNGLETEEVLGSRSFYRTLTSDSILKPWMELPYTAVEDFNPKITSVQTTIKFGESKLQVSPGPEYDLLTDRQKEELLNRDFHIAKDYNRMAYQVEESIAPHGITMLTSATLPGTVQLTPSGKPIILMRDAQTTGGYPRVLQLAKPSISQLAQKKQGDVVQFVLSR